VHKVLKEQGEEKAAIHSHFMRLQSQWKQYDLLTAILALTGMIINFGFYEYNIVYD
jgi:hypothetical protein